MDLHHELVAAEHVLKSLPNDMVLDLNGELSAQRGTNNESLGSFDFVVRSKKTGEPVRVIEVKSPRGRIGSVTDLYDGITHTKGKVQPVAGDGCQTQATVVVDLKKRWRT